MTQYTQVYGDFLVRTNEVNILRSKAAGLERSCNSFKHGNEISALCRGAVVLLSSHIEAYIKELGEHTLDAIYQKNLCRSKLAPQFFYYISKEKIKSIRDASEPEDIAEHIFSFLEVENDYWQKKTNFNRPVSSEAFNTGFSNPTFDKVKAYFGRFGYSDFRHDFYRVLGREAQPTETNLNQIVFIRNSIAHGDPSATKTPSDIFAMINTAKLFCRTSDKIFGSWCRTNLCTIR